MAHEQNSPRGLWAKKRIDIVGSSSDTITGNSTGIVLGAGIKISNRANATITGNSTGIVLVAGIKISNQANATITGDASGIVVAGAIKISNKKSISANATGLILPTSAAIPTARSSCKFAILTNSTGNAVLINTTGTTWKYLNVTSVLPT